jgi:predicted TIM-barrel fold metal-dependent hydrolase
MVVSELVAIDVHTHAEVSASGASSLSEELSEASSKYFKVDGNRKLTVPEMASYYRQRKIAAVVFTVDAEAATGQPSVSNEEVAEACAANADVLIPFASIDPWKGKAGALQARRLAEQYGVRGFKFHRMSAFFPRPPRAPAHLRRIEGLPASPPGCDIGAGAFPGVVSAEAHQTPMHIRE